MRKRLGISIAVAAAVLAVTAAIAPARVTNVGATVSIGSRLNPTGVEFRGGVETRGNSYCAQRRIVELFRDGVKVDQGETDRYGVWTGSYKGEATGTYVAKTKKRQLPASMQREPGKANRIICKAAQSKPHKVPEESQPSPS
jgi:hypothetical protein